MDRIILIRFGEIFLKGNNRYFFESALVKNIRHALKDFDFVLTRSQNRYYVENYDEGDEKAILDCLLHVPGIHSVSPAYKMTTDMKTVSANAVSLMADKSGTFRVTVNRADKKINRSSTELASEFGGDVLESNAGLKVNLFEYDTELYIDMRENGVTYMFTDKIYGVQGMPVGTAGKGLLLLSGGIDSPVAGYMMAKRGMKLDAVHFHSAPYTSEMAKQKVVDLARLVSKYATEIDLYVVPFTDIQLAIHQNCPAELMITVMRRFMMRISERLAFKTGAGAVITGESLGQVASQTLQSITVTNSVIEKLPVFRPLIGMDKSEIMKISRDIGTYETSILPYEDCCTVFLPKNPVTRPKVEIAQKAESKLDVETLISKAMENIELIKVK